MPLSICKQSEFHPLMENDEEFKIVFYDDTVEIVFRASDGTERPVTIPVLPHACGQRNAA